MLTFIVLAITLLVLAAVVAVITIAGGAVFLLPVLEVVGFVTIVVAIVKAITKRKKK